MKRIVVTIGLVAGLAFGSQAQNESKGKVIVEDKGKGFYSESILKDVTAVEETTEDLVIQGVQPFAAELHGVIARYDREIVFDVRAP